MRIRRNKHDSLCGGRPWSGRPHHSTRDAPAQCGGRRDICVPETEKLIDLDAIKKPTLIIYGDKDPYMNFKALDNVIDELPEGSRVEVIEGGAHSMMLEKPYHREFQDKIVDFLKSN